MGFSKMYTTKVGLVLNLLTGLISLQYHALFDGMLSTVMSTTSLGPEIWIRMVTSKKSRNWFMLDQEDDPELDDEWLTSNEHLTRFRKTRDKRLGRVKGSE